MGSGIGAEYSILPSPRAQLHETAGTLQGELFTKGAASLALGSRKLKRDTANLGFSPTWYSPPVALFHSRRPRNVERAGDLSTPCAQIVESGPELSVPVTQNRGRSPQFPVRSRTLPHARRPCRGPFRDSHPPRAVNNETCRESPPSPRAGRVAASRAGLSSRARPPTQSGQRATCAPRPRALFRRRGTPRNHRPAGSP